MNRLDGNEILIAQIRALQAIHAQAHEALKAWGAWSMDRRGIFPTMSPPGLWDQYRAAEGEEYGEEPKEAPLAIPVKSEGPETPPYDEKLATVLDERMHGPGGLAMFQRHVVKIAYATRELPEYQMPRQAGCTEDAFRERLEAALLFVGRFC